MLHKELPEDNESGHPEEYETTISGGLDYSA
jgi:hypothetical protein